MGSVQLRCTGEEGTTLTGEEGLLHPVLGVWASEFAEVPLRGDNVGVADIKDSEFPKESRVNPYLAQVKRRSSHADSEFPKESRVNPYLAQVKRRSSHAVRASVQYIG
ncbi:UNVERIFIED_CONTAM: hypothetical protein FKN15_063889 [Acipenser sinensis]